MFDFHVFFRVTSSALVLSNYFKPVLPYCVVWSYLNTLSSRSASFLTWSQIAWFGVFFCFCFFCFWVRSDHWLLCFYHCLWWYSYHWTKIKTKIKSLSRLQWKHFSCPLFTHTTGKNYDLFFLVVTCQETWERRFVFRLISISWLFCNMIKGKGWGEASLPTSTNDYLTPTVTGKEHKTEGGGWAEEQQTLVLLGSHSVYGELPHEKDQRKDFSSNVSLVG